MVSGVVSPTIRDSRHPDETGKLRGFVFMATRQASAQAITANAEVSEREYQTTLNAAVAATEDEIFTDALSGEELDNDGDTSLEEMGDDLEGEAEESDEAEEGAEGESEEAAEGEDGEETETAEAAGEDEGQEAAEQPRDQRGQVRDRDPAIPPARLREANARSRELEERLAAQERIIAEYNGRIAELSARVNTPPPRQAEAPAPKPDMFAEPDKYEAWVLEQAERRANAIVERGLNSYQQQQQQREAQRVDQSLADAARGERAFEFQAAYNRLTALDPRNPRDQATVRGIYNAPDPAKALFDWWDRNGGEEYREQVFSQLAPRIQERQHAAARNGNGRAQPRHEIRPAQRLPSLNGATGSNVQRTADPEMLDGSEASVFRYGAAR